MSNAQDINDIRESIAHLRDRRDRMEAKFDGLQFGTTAHAAQMDRLERLERILRGEREALRNAKAAR